MYSPCGGVVCFSRCVFVVAKYEYAVVDVEI
jgi:hypothetical protein